MEEIGAAIQMIQVTMQGISIAGKATKEILKMLQRLMIFVACTTKELGIGIAKVPRDIKYHKKRGKTNIDNLRKKGGTLEVVSLNKEEYEKFQKLAKRWGILYTRNPVAKDLGKVYLSYATEQAPNMEKILEALKKEKLMDYKKEAVKEAKKANLNGKERIEFIDSYVEMAINRFQEENKNCSVEEYFEKSALGTCTNEEFDLAMREKFGSIYDEVKDWEQDLKKTDFEEIIGELSQYRKNTPPVYLCKQNEPESYIEVSWEIRKNEGGKDFLNTQYRVFNNGEEQKCDEFPHGKFWHFTQKSGQASSGRGKEHWDKLIEEMKTKGGFNDEVLVFENEQEYNNYKEQVGRVREYEKTFTENTMLQEWEKRREQSVVLQLDRDKIVDYDEINRKCKIDTGICDDHGRHYYMWTDMNNVFYTAEHKFEVLMKPEEEITLCSYFGTEKISLVPEEIGNTEKTYQPEKEEVPEQKMETGKGNHEEEQISLESENTEEIVTQPEKEEILEQKPEDVKVNLQKPETVRENHEEEQISPEPENTEVTGYMEQPENEDVLWQNPDILDAYLEENSIQESFHEPADWMSLWDTEESVIRLEKEEISEQKLEDVKVDLQKPNDVKVNLPKPEQSVQHNLDDAKRLENLSKRGKTLKKNMVQKDMLPDKAKSR